MCTRCTLALGLAIASRALAHAFWLQCSHVIAMTIDCTENIQYNIVLSADDYDLKEKQTRLGPRRIMNYIQCKAIMSNKEIAGRGFSGSE